MKIEDINPHLKSLIKSIKLVALDVDGVKEYRRLASNIEDENKVQTIIVVLIYILQLMITKRKYSNALSDEKTQGKGAIGKVSHVELILCMRKVRK